jgi:hypothetical protein
MPRLAIHPSSDEEADNANCDNHETHDEEHSGMRVVGIVQVACAFDDAEYSEDYSDRRAH